MADETDNTEPSPWPADRKLRVVLWGLVFFFAGFAALLVLGEYLAQPPYGVALLAVTLFHVLVLIGILNGLYPAQSLAQAVRRVVLALAALAVVFLPLAFLGLGAVVWGVAGLVWMTLAFHPYLHYKPLRPVVALFGLALLALWMSPVPWMHGRPWSFFARNVLNVVINTTLATYFVTLIGRRSSRRIGLLIGAATGVTAVLVTTASWFTYYFSMASGWGAAIACGVAVVAAVWGGLEGLVLPRHFAFRDWLEFRCIKRDARSKALVPQLGRLLYQADAVHFERLSFRRWKAELDDEKAVPVLVNALRHRDPWIRYSAAETLGRVGPPARSAIPDLLPLVGGDPLPGDRAAEALARIGSDGSDGADVLVEMLTDEDEAVRAAAAGAITLDAPHTPCSADALIQALGDPDSSVRQRAAAALRQLDEPTEAVMRALQSCAADPALLVRVEARNSLKELALKATVRRD